MCNGQCAACPAGAVATACQGNACVANTCSAGTNLCGGTCKASDDVMACGPSCAVCGAPAGTRAICSQNLCDVRCTGTTTCKGRCGAACTWNQASASTQAAFIDVFVDAQGAVHAASVFEHKLRYHRLSAGSLSNEAVSTAISCVASDTVNDSAPIFVADGSAGRPGIACGYGNIMSGYRWNAGTSKWDWTSIITSVSFLSYVHAVTQSNGVGAFATLMPMSGGYPAQRYVDLLDVESTGWTTSRTEQVPLNFAPSDISLLRTVGARRQVAYRLQQISNGSLIDAGSVHIAQSEDGGFSITSAPWVVADAFGQERDGTLFAVTRSLWVYRLAPNRWETVGPIATPNGPVTSLHVLVDPAGIVRVVYGDSGGVSLASYIGGSWVVEQVTSSVCYGAKVAVNASGKVAVACINSQIHVYD